MPSSATLTSFYTFSGGNRAKSSEVNANFGNFRGHFFPIDPTTTAGANNAYNVGSSDYRWDSGFFQNVDLSITSTASLIISGLSSGLMSFKKDGSEVFKITNNGYAGVNKAPIGITLSASEGFVSGSPSTTTAVTITGSGHIANSTCTIVTTGRPVWIGLVSGTGTSNGFVEAFNTTISASSFGYSCPLSFARDGSLFPPHVLGHVKNTTTVVVTDTGIKVSPKNFFMIDTPSAGTYHYSLYMGSLTSNAGVTLSNVKLIAYEF